MNAALVGLGYEGCWLGNPNEPERARIAVTVREKEDLEEVIRQQIVSACAKLQGVGDQAARVIVRDAVRV